MEITIATPRAEIETWLTTRAWLYMMQPHHDVLPVRYLVSSSQIFKKLSRALWEIDPTGNSISFHFQVPHCR